MDCNELVDIVATSDCTDRKTKIIATLGPASFGNDMLEQLMNAGANILRLNSSHRQPGQFEELVPRVRAVAKKLNKDVQLMADLQGVKYRCASVEGGTMPLEQGKTVALALMEGENEPCSLGRITLTRTRDQIDMVRNIVEGMKLMLDDGTMRLRVLRRVSQDEVECLVEVGGILKSRKGINVPDLKRTGSALTEKDLDDLKCLLSLEIEYIAMSFVEKAEDVQEVRAAIKDFGVTRESSPQVLAKIEKPAAIRNIESIVAASDGGMVERGDLGCEMGAMRVPFFQKLALRKYNEACKFVITATQLIETMTTKLTPTCAEVSDVANAVYDGTDAVMLSGESAMGVDPANVVRTLGQIIVEAELHEKLVIQHVKRKLVK
jgi:pyruvate kinase